MNYVLDTNVLINDPSSIFKFANSTVVILTIVLYELDNLKKMQNATGQSARQVARLLEELRKEGPLHKGVDLPNNSKLKVVETNTEGKGDDIIIDFCRGLEDHILVTEDTLMRVIADSKGIEAQRYANAYIDPEIKKEQKSLQVPSEYIDHISERGLLQLSEKYEDIPVNTYLSLKFGSQSVLARSEGDRHLALVRARNIMSISPKNSKQAFLLDALLDQNIQLVAATGQAGTGKTLLSLAAGLHQVTELQDPLYKSVSVTRSVMPLGNQDLGYLPGSEAEKMDPWIRPIYDNLEFIIGNKDAASYYKERGHLKVEALAYFRGRSIPQQFIIVDEAQNLQQHEVKTIVTRAGAGTKIVMLGDIDQIDNPYLDYHNNGLSYVIEKFAGQEMFAHIALDKTERSRLAELGARLL